MPVRKVPAVLATLTGVRLPQGARRHDARRHAAGAVGTPDAPLRAAVPAAAVVDPDDTGWRVGGEPASLRAVETDAAPVAPRRSRHRHAAVHAVLPADDVGVMVTERGRSYEAQAFAEVHQHTCLAHGQRSRSDVLATKTGRARDVGAGLTELVQAALPRWHDDRDGPVPDFRTAAKAVQEDRTSPLRDRRRQDPAHQWLLNELGGPHDRGNLVHFVDAPRSEPPNHRAERALRPAVITRHVAQGSKHERGAHAFAAFTSVVRTLAKNRAASLVEGRDPLCRSPSPQAFSPSTWRRNHRR
jgi:transposase